MPFYEYECDRCKDHPVVLQAVNDPALVECPICKHEKVRKLVSAAGFRLKGSGWYATDFKDRPKAKPNEESGGAVVAAENVVKEAKHASE